MPYEIFSSISIFLFSKHLTCIFANVLQTISYYSAIHCLTCFSNAFLWPLHLAHPFFIFFSLLFLSFPFPIYSTPSGSRAEHHIALASTGYPRQILNIHIYVSIEISQLTLLPTINIYKFFLLI